MARTARGASRSCSYDGAAPGPSSTGASDLAIAGTTINTRDKTMTSSSAGTAASHAPPHHLHISTTTDSNHHHQHSSRSPTGGGGARSPSSGTNQACAACKYQRRKCNPDCPLAPYFPADQQQRFLQAHRLFGVSNILKTLRRLRPDLCADAMATLIYQAEMRAQDPVGGCYRLVLALERQLEADRAELAAVLHHLALCRQAAPPRPADLDVAASSNNNQQLLLNADQEVVDALYASHDATTTILQTDHQLGHDNRSPQHHHDEQQQQQQLFDYFYYDTAGDDGSSKPVQVTLDINVDTMQPFDYDDDHKVHGEQLPSTEQQHQHQSLDINNNCHFHHKEEEEECEMKAALLVDALDMRPAVDVNADDIDDDVKAAVAVNAGININAVDVNAHMDLNQELHEQEDTKNNVNIAVGEAPRMAVESSSQCGLGLGFSAL